jgi:hypothetical protein
LTVAAAAALRDGGVRVRASLRDRAGIIVGAYQLSPASAGNFTESIQQRGLPRVSAAAFARMVLNAPAGFCASTLALKGPMSTITTGPGGGLVAMIYASQMLATRSDADLLVAGGIDELPPQEGDGESGHDGSHAEGAACLLLTRSEALRRQATGARIRVAGWGLAGPGRLAEAAGLALAMAGRTPADLDALFGHVDAATLAAELGRGAQVLPCRDPAPVLGYGAASTSAFAAVDAALALRAGHASVAMVAADTGRSASAAMVLVEEGGES